MIKVIRFSEYILYVCVCVWGGGGGVGEGRGAGLGVGGEVVQEYFTYIEPIVHQRWAKTEKNQSYHP